MATSGPLKAAAQESVLVLRVCATVDTSERISGMHADPACMHSAIVVRGRGKKTGEREEIPLCEYARVCVSAHMRVCFLAVRHALQSLMQLKLQAHSQSQGRRVSLHKLI